MNSDITKNIAQKTIQSDAISENLAQIDPNLLLCLGGMACITIIATVGCIYMSKGELSLTSDGITMKSTVSIQE